MYAIFVDHFHVERWHVNDETLVYLQHAIMQANLINQQDNSSDATSSLI